MEQHVNLLEEQSLYVLCPNEKPEVPNSWVNGRLKNGDVVFCDRKIPRTNNGEDTYVCYLIDYKYIRIRHGNEGHYILAKKIPYPFFLSKPLTVKKLQHFSPGNYVHLYHCEEAMVDVKDVKDYLCL